MNHNLVLSPTQANHSVSRPPMLPAAWPLGWIARSVLPRYNRLWRTLRRQKVTPSDFRALQEVRAFASQLTDIDEHLELMLIEGLLCRPRLIVELGVRDGSSTFVFKRVSRICGSTLVSGDLDDCSAIVAGSNTHFYRGDDIEFSECFPAFCATRGLVPSIDLLFIDTSHYYDHTVQEIAAWFPFLSQNAKVIFHDTHLKPIGLRNDGCFTIGWDNQRGVVRAIEEFLNVQIDERCKCTVHSQGWLLRHWPNCNGLTILDRLS